MLKKLVIAVGFSKGWAEFMPKNPPPFVPSILIDSRAATGPTEIFCIPDSRVETFTKLLKVIGLPYIKNIMAKINAAGINM